MVPGGNPGEGRSGMERTHAGETKHERLLRYIRALPVGSVISVRRMAREHGVSEGTAYRALKEAETLGYVATKERIGTVRIERKRSGHPDQLTFAEVLDIVQGQLLGGREGLNKTLHKFVIGAMELDAMMKYIDAGSLLIVGNRENAHRCALEHGAGVLITGGFGTSDDVKAYADEQQLPIMSCRHDTFTVASMINRAMYDRQIKRKIMTIVDLIDPAATVHALKQSATVAEFRRLSEATGQTRFPVTDEWNRVVGIVASKDVADAAPDQTLDRLMTRRPLTVTVNTPVAAAAHRIVSEGIELLPVVDRKRKLIGVVTRAEVLRAMQFANRPQIGETFDALIWSGFSEERDEEGRVYFTGLTTAQMAGPLGTVSEGVLAVLMMRAAARTAADWGRKEHVMENMTTYFLRTIPIDAPIAIRTVVLEASRRHMKMEVQVLQDGETAAKAMLTAHSIDLS